ncbi:LINE-1 retrotransposable element ORF1 protein [Frankliniella fusca]|uniref:LINE-1 retrotransposable element ORF1 protein n=1 Tax=Frankliniella fusca TaxID=407009 RepID=A0AAE1LEX6_9NEOP|nr:LINE-1 retrotransposable element ORF1 protein [Frankliniella fusca]KAK3916219.1 LINE-1 retrotransposable element ORF1 protein [Frankliniella fusca]
MAHNTRNNPNSKQTVAEMSKKELVQLISECLKPVQSDIKEVKDDVDSLRTDIEFLTSKLSEKDKIIEGLQRRLAEQEQYARRNNLRIFGVDESQQKEDTDKLVMDVARRIGVQIDKSQIDRSHRLGKPGPKPRPIIVKFIGYSPRRSMFTAKKALKGSGITIREDLTRERLELLKEASEAYNQRNVWTQDGVVMVKIGDFRPKRLKSIDELHALLEIHPPPE